MYKKHNIILFNTLLLIIIIISGCTSSTKINNEQFESTYVEDVDRETANSFNELDYSIKYKYSGDDVYKKAIVDYMISHATVSDANLLYIPIPVIVDFDDSDKKDVKLYGTYYTYGLSVKDELFQVVEDYKYSACYHISNNNGLLEIKNIDYATDGINYELSLFRITDKDMNIVNDVIMSNDEESDIAKESITEAVYSYVTENNLNIKGIRIAEDIIFYFNDGIDENEKNNIANIRENINKLISENYGDRGYTNLDFSTKTFTRKIWRYGIGDAVQIFLEDSLDKEHRDNFIEAWDSLVDSIIEATKTAKEYLNVNDLSKYHFKVSFLDDRNHNTVFLDIVDGDVKYNIIDK